MLFGPHLRVVRDNITVSPPHKLVQEGGPCTRVMGLLQERSPELEVLQVGAKHRSPAVGALISDAVCGFSRLVIVNSDARRQGRVAGTSPRVMRSLDKDDAGCGNARERNQDSECCTGAGTARGGEGDSEAEYEKSGKGMQHRRCLEHDWERSAREITFGQKWQAVWFDSLAAHYGRQL
ncbi:hypothetical protein C8Q78DRAFT_993968 [Trametes maxima]|nr:hypothetical protein C8Q78DRAFT_993968 [Trametes maxima]